MELDAEDRPGAVLQAHDLAIFGACGHLEFGWQVAVLDRQAVVARGGEWVLQAGENASIVMMDLAGLAVHQGSGADHFAAKRLAN